MIWTFTANKQKTTKKQKQKKPMELIGTKRQGIKKGLKRLQRKEMERKQYKPVKTGSAIGKYYNEHILCHVNIISGIGKEDVAP